MKPLNIVHMEDNVLDAELIHNKIKKEGIKCNVKLVGNRQQFLEAIEDKGIDLILFNYSISSFCGMEALEHVKQKLPGVPFIFISDTIGEEKTVEILKKGATDYIIKDNLARLVPAINRAIKEVQEKGEKIDTEEELRRSEERFELAVKATNDVIWDYNKITGKIWWNDNFTKVFGNYENEDISSFNFWLSKIHPDDSDGIIKSYQQSVAKHENYWTEEYRFQKADRSFAYVLNRGYFVYDDKGNLIRVVGAIIDINEMKKNEVELIEAKDKAEIADKLKSEFLAQISHEIRTPLNTIMSFISMLQMEIDYETNEDIKMIFNGIETAGRRLIRTVDLILNMSLLQTGKYEPFFIKADLRPLIEGIVHEFFSTAAMKKLKLSYNFKTNNTLQNCDEYTVSQIMQNLIDNAIKYTEKGKIEVNVYRDDENKLRIAVKDTGIGISKKFLSNLFHPFTQESTGYSRKFEGNGLGLALVKSYAEINNAELNVQSKKGVGSTFTIIFQ